MIYRNQLIKKFFLNSSILLFFGSFFISSAHAITYGVDDCSDNSSNTNCGHPNTVMLSGFDADGYGFVRCSGSLLDKNEERLLILTAGHCVQRWIEYQSTGYLVDLGVAFDARVETYYDGSVITWDQFLLGGQALLNLQYGPSLNSFNIYHDYAVVWFPVPESGLQTVDGTAVDLTGIDPIVLPPLGYLDDLANPTTQTLITNVGYGTGEKLPIPGEGGNAGGVSRNFSTFGNRMVSASYLTSVMMRDESMALLSQNPARSYGGTCGGDSGGPSFHVDEQGEEVQIGIISSGDKTCRGSSILSRTDIPGAQAFLECAISAEDSVEFAGCGCTSLNTLSLCD